MLLAIETSCDETSIAIISQQGELVSLKIGSQIRRHQPYGGVVPELASRLHTETIHFLIQECLEDAGVSFSELKHIAVTEGPGLEGALLVGAVVARTLGNILNIPVIGVNHLHGHIYSGFMSETPPQFPFVCCLVSGGHTLLILAKNHFEFEKLGTTQDDACGEAFDKVARVLGLRYPGGPEIEKSAKEGDENRFKFPKPMIKDGLKFSFSGLKTAVIQTVHQLRKENEALPVADISASFQKTVADVLAIKTKRAVEQTGVQQIVLCGGVFSNLTIRKTIEIACPDQQISCPPPYLCTDNAGMIGMAGYYAIQTKKAKQPVDVNPNLEI